MEKENFTPEKGFEIISQVVNEARVKFEEDGSMYIMWGILVGLASFAQFMLLTYEYYSINYYPYFILPLGAIVCWIYYYRKGKSKSNQITNIIAVAWGSIGLNIMVLGFLFYNFIQAALIPIILIMLGIAYIITARAIKSKIVLISGILINISGLVCFMLENIYHPLLMSLVSVLFVLIPGIILQINYKKRDV